MHVHARVVQMAASSASFRMSREDHSQSSPTSPVELPIIGEGGCALVVQRHAGRQCGRLRRRLLRHFETGHHGRELTGFDGE